MIEVRLLCASGKISKLTKESDSDVDLGLKGQDNLDKVVPAAYVET